MTRLQLRYCCLVAALLCKNGGARSSDITRQPQIVMEVSPFVVCLSQTYQTKDGHRRSLGGYAPFTSSSCRAAGHPCRSSSDNVK